MSESKHPLECFQHYFSVRPALAVADRALAFRIRYRVYCEEFGYEPAERFPDRMEMDEFDAVSTHALITHVATGMPAGCVRLCPASAQGVDRLLPFDKYCSESLDPVAMAAVPASRDRICEASRFAVDGAFRRRSGEALTRFGEIASLDLSDTERRTFPGVSLALMLAAAAMADLLERPYVFSVMEPFLPRLLNHSGVAFRRMGQDLHYHGIRAVYLSDARDFVRDMQGEFRELYAWIYSQLQSLSPGPATALPQVQVRRVASGQYPRRRSARG